MSIITLDGHACSLQLPPECLSATQAASYAKRQLRAAWVDVCTPTWQQDIYCFDFKLGELAPIGAYDSWGDRPLKKRLFLSARGWRPGGAVAEDASLLAFGEPKDSEATPAADKLPAPRDAEMPTADELPAALLRCGRLQLRVFSAQRAQVTIDLPDGSSVKLPVFQSTCGADVTSYVAALLGCEPTALRLWPGGGGTLLGEDEKVVPGTRFRVKLIGAPEPDAVQIYVRTLLGETMAVRLGLDSTVMELKHAVHDYRSDVQRRIPVEWQRLIFEGRQLENGRTLASYDIGDGDKVHLVLRLRSGIYTLFSGDAGDSQQLGLAPDERELAAIAAAGRTPLEVVLPNGSSVLLSCGEHDGRRQVLASLRESLAAEAAVLAADVDGLQDMAAMRELLHQAQAALRRRRREA